MPDPAQWFQFVLRIGAVQATVVGISLAWIISGAPTPAFPPQALKELSTPLLATVSTFLPFLAYGGDSRALLQHHPRESSVQWQAIGGLIGLSLSLALIHLAVSIATIRSDLGVQSSWLLLYKLLFPPMIIGGMGAAIGILAAVLARCLAHSRMER